MVFIAVRGSFHSHVTVACFSLHLTHFSVHGWTKHWEIFAYGWLDVGVFFLSSFLSFIVRHSTKRKKKRRYGSNLRAIIMESLRRNYHLSAARKTCFQRAHRVAEAEYTWFNLYYPPEWVFFSLDFRTLRFQLKDYENCFFASRWGRLTPSVTWWRMCF